MAAVRSDSDGSWVEVCACKPLPEPVGLLSSDASSPKGLLSSGASMPLQPRNAWPAEQTHQQALTGTSTWPAEHPGPSKPSTCRVWERI
jgi:hypothetical protein